MLYHVIALSSNILWNIYIYIYKNFKPKTTRVVVNISKYKNTLIYHKYYVCIYIYIFIYYTYIHI